MVTASSVHSFRSLTCCLKDLALSLSEVNLSVAFVRPVEADRYDDFKQQGENT